MLEEMAPEIEREEAEARDAQDFLQMLEQTYADAGTKLKQARSELERAQRDMSRAQQQRQSAEQRAEAARQAAGLAGATKRPQRCPQVDAGCGRARSGIGRGGVGQGPPAEADKT